MKERKIIFWDFDGVIKDSVTVKSEAFEQLFLSFGKEVAKSVRQHHEKHSGVSRYEKIPVYLDWVGEQKNKENVKKYCDRFSRLVKKAVVNSPWVPGVREYLLKYYPLQDFVLITATPQEEIIQILSALDLYKCFREVHGAPISKSEIIQDVLLRWKCPPEDALVVGDSESDYNAARINHVTFWLRRTSLNKNLQERFNGTSFDSLKYE